MKDSYELRFLREELNHVVMTMPIKPEDVLEVRRLTVDELYSWVLDKQMSVSYQPGNEDTRFYEWNSGKEFCEGEGERGMWNFTLGKYREGQRATEVELGSINAEVVPELTNAERIFRAESALGDYDYMRDLLADLLHYCDHHKLDFVDELRIATNNYQSEIE